MDIERWSVFFGRYLPIQGVQCEVVAEIYVKYGHSLLNPGQCVILNLMLAGF